MAQCRRRELDINGFGEILETDTICRGPSVRPSVAVDAELMQATVADEGRPFKTKQSYIVFLGENDVAPGIPVRPAV